MKICTILKLPRRAKRTFEADFVRRSFVPQDDRRVVWGAQRVVAVKGLGIVAIQNLLPSLSIVTNDMMGCRFFKIFTATALRV